MSQGTIPFLYVECMSVQHRACLVIKVVRRTQSVIENLLSATARCGCFLELCPPIVLTCLQSSQIFHAHSSLFPNLDLAWLCSHFRIRNRSVSVLPGSLLWPDLTHSFGGPRLFWKDCTYIPFVPITLHHPKIHGCLRH